MGSQAAVPTALAELHDLPVSRRSDGKESVGFTRGPRV